MAFSLALDARPSRLWQSARTWSSVAMVVSPGKVVSSAPWAQPSLTASSGSRREQPIKETSRETIAAAHAVVEHPVQRPAQCNLAVDPGHRAPTVPVGGMNLAQGSCDHLDLRVFGDGLFDHIRKCRRIELGLGGDLRARQFPGPFADPLRCRPAHRHSCTMRSSTSTARSRRPRYSRILPVIQIEADTAPAVLAACMPSMTLRGGGGKRGEDAAAMEPAHAARENLAPVKIARLQTARSFIAAVIENHRGAHALAAVAKDSGHVGAVTPSCAKCL